MLIVDFKELYIEEIEVGDIVYLNSNEEVAMTITEMKFNTPNGVPIIGCGWFDKNDNYLTAYIPMTCLKEKM